jgi:hypothetical protein
LRRAGDKNAQRLRRAGDTCSDGRARRRPLARRRVGASAASISNFFHRPARPRAAQDTFMLTILDPGSFDRSRLRDDILTHARESVRLKTLLRTRWERPMAEEQRRHARLRRRLTELHILYAASRAVAATAPKGLHVVHPPCDARDTSAAFDAVAYNTRVAARVLNEYALTAADSKEVRAS